MIEHGLVGYQLVDPYETSGLARYQQLDGNLPTDRSSTKIETPKKMYDNSPSGASYWWGADPTVSLHRMIFPIKQYNDHPLVVVATGSHLLMWCYWCRQLNFQLGLAATRSYFQLNLVGHLGEHGQMLLNTSSINLASFALSTEKDIYIYKINTG